MDMQHAVETPALQRARVELAAALRWAARLGMQSGVCNHFSAAAPDRPDLMLINPEGYFWAEVTPRSLVLATHDGTPVNDNGNTVELTAFCIHAPIHRLLPHATAVFHTHMTHATAVCSQEGGEIEPSFLSGLEFHKRIAYDPGFSGAATTVAEGERLAGLLADNVVLMMENHGPLVVGDSIGSALLRLIYLEDICKIQLLAQSATGNGAGGKLKHISPHLVKQTPDDPEMYRAYGEKLITAVIRTLAHEDPEFLA